MKQNGSRILQDILQKQSELGENADIDAFVKEQLAVYGIASDEATLDHITRRICGTIDAMNSATVDLQRFRAEGKSRNQWFRNQLTAIMQKIPEPSRSGALQALKNALVGAMNETLGLPADTQGASGLSDILKSYDFTGENQKEVSKNILKDIETTTRLQHAMEGDALEDADAVSDILSMENSAVKAAFDTALNSKEEIALKKSAAAAMFIAKEKGCAENLKDRTVEEIAAISDMGITGAKVSKKVGEGKLGIMDAVDVIVDKSVAVFSTLIGNTVEFVSEKVGEVTGIVLAKRFGQNMKMGQQLGKAVGRMAGQKASDWIKTGSQKLAQGIKKTNRKIADLVNKGISSVETGLATAKKKLLSLFS